MNTLYYIALLLVFLTGSTQISKEDPMFEKYPVNSTYRLKTLTRDGKPIDAPIPSHCRDCNSIIIFGFAEYNAVQAIVRDEEGAYPGSAHFAPAKLKSPDGRIVASHIFWLSNVHDAADFSPYSQFGGCFSTVPREDGDKVMECIGDETACLIDAFSEYSYHCYRVDGNSDDYVIAYAREIYGNNMFQVEVETQVEERENGQIVETYDFKNICTTSIQYKKSPVEFMDKVPSIIKQMGLMKGAQYLYDATRLNEQESNMITKRGISTMYNFEKKFPEFRVITRTKESYLSVWNDSKDSISFQEPLYQRLRFEPKANVIAKDIKAVFFLPHNHKDVAQGKKDTDL